MKAKFAAPPAELRLYRELQFLYGRNATFLLALILIASPVAGLRSIRATRFLTAGSPNLQCGFVRLP